MAMRGKSLPAKPLKHMKRVAYIRVSKHEQRPDRQIDGLRDLCDELHIETISAVKKHRPVYEKIIRKLKPGDAFVIWDLDRAYRSTRDALNELERLTKSGVTIQIANLNIDTSTPHGTLIYTIISALAEFERRLLSQRTKEGIEAARKRGKRIGRPPKLSDKKVQETALLLKTSDISCRMAAAQLGVSTWTLQRRLRDLRTH